MFNDWLNLNLFGWISINQCDSIRLQVKLIQFDSLSASLFWKWHRPISAPLIWWYTIQIEKFTNQVNNNGNGCGALSILLFFFICKSNCKLSHNDSSVYVETNGCNIKINEDITMNPNYDTEYGVQAHSLTMKKKWLICESDWLTGDGSKDKEIEKQWKRRNKNDDCGGRVMMITADNECVYHKLFICLASSLCSIVRESLLQN